MPAGRQAREAHDLEISGINTARSAPSRAQHRPDSNRQGRAPFTAKRWTVKRGAGKGSLQGTLFKGPSSRDPLQGPMTRRHARSPVTVVTRPLSRWVAGPGCGLPGARGPTRPTPTTSLSESRRTGCYGLPNGSPCIRLKVDVPSASEGRRQPISYIRTY